MQFTPLTVILIMLGILLAGYGLGMLEMHLKRQKQISDLQAALKLEQEKGAAAGIPAPAPTAAEVTAEAPDDLRLRIGPNGEPIIHLGKAAIDSPLDATPEQRRLLTALLAQLRPWVESGSAAASATPGPAAVGLQPAGKKNQPAAGGTKAAPSYKSIVEQIDDLLQPKLMASPYRERNIHLAEGTGGMVLVMDGNKSYEGVDAVPDPEIKALIRQAVADWEKVR